MNIEQIWLINIIMGWELKYFEHAQHHSGLGRTVREGVAAGRGWGRTGWMWTRDIKDTLDMKVQKVEQTGNK